MIQKLEFKRVSLLRRIASIFFDAVICFSLMFILASFVVEPIISNTTDYGIKYQEYVKQCEDSHLFVYYQENEAVSVISSNYDSKLTDFYNDNDLGYTLADYELLKHDNSDQFVDSEGNHLEKPIFIYNSETSSYTENIDASDEVKIFYSDLVTRLANEFLTTEEMKELSTVLSSYLIFCFLIGLVVSTLFVYLLFPMIFKDGATLGKKMMQMKVINMKNGQNPSKLQVLIRFTYFALIGMVLGILSYGITIIANIVFIMVNKNRAAIHDVIAKTLVVCGDNYSASTSESDSFIIEYEDGLKEGNNY